MKYKNFLLYYKQLFRKNRQKNRNDSKAHKGIPDNAYFFINEHSKNRILKLSILIIGLILFLTIIGTLLFKKYFIDDLWIDLMLIDRIFGDSIRFLLCFLMIFLFFS